jgi:hypothetical protein
MDESEKVNARLEHAGLTTARALQEISGHWERGIRGDAPGGRVAVRCREPAAVVAFTPVESY